MTDNAPVNDPAAVLAKNEQLLSEKRALQARLQTLEAAATAAGIDLANPAAFIEQRESATRAAREREAKVRDAVLMKLVQSGTPVAPTVVNAIIGSALADPNVDVTASGATSHVETWLGIIAPPRRPAPGLPDIPKAQPSSGSTGPTSLLDLVKQGPAAMTAFASSHPERYAELKAAHEQGIATPRGGRPTG